MFKTPILNLRIYRRYLTSSFRSWWYLGFVLFPTALFGVLNIYEAEIVAWLMALHPPSVSQGTAFFRDLIELAANEILWIGFFLLLSCVLLVYPDKAKLENVFEMGGRVSRIQVSLLIFFLFFYGAFYTGDSTLSQFPNSSEEYAYLFQADMFSHGKVWQPAHDLPDFFYLNNVVENEGIVLSPFPPGWSLILSAAFEMGLPPFLINPVLGLLALVVFYFFARHLYGAKVATWSVLGVAMTGYYVFNSASFFPHVSTFLFTLLFVCSLNLYHVSRRPLYAVMAGALMGFIILTGYFSALLISVPFLLYLIYYYRLAVLRVFLFMLMGVAPFVLFLFSYHYTITGDPFLSVLAWAYPGRELGFVKGHTFFKGLGHVVRWVILFFYWCSPGMFILYIVFLYRKLATPVKRFANPQDYLLVCLMIGYFFYYQVGGDQYGPRFLFAGFPFLVLFVTHQVLQAREKWAMAFFLAGVLYAIVKFPFISYREKEIVGQRKDLYDLVKEEKITNAVVFVASPTSPIRPMRADDLTRNDAKFRNDVIYAVELPGISDQLMEYYRDRSFYRYTRDLDERHGTLIKIK